MLDIKFIKKSPQFSFLNNKHFILTCYLQWYSKAWLRTSYSGIPPQEATSLCTLLQNLVIGCHFFALWEHTCGHVPEPGCVCVCLLTHTTHLSNRSKAGSSRSCLQGLASCSCPTTGYKTDRSPHQRNDV